MDGAAAEIEKGPASCRSTPVYVPTRSSEQYGALNIEENMMQSRKSCKFFLASLLSLSVNK